jgi:hypothetical protein
MSTNGKKRKFDASEAYIPPSKKPAQDALVTYLNTLSGKKKMPPREQLAVSVIPPLEAVTSVCWRQDGKSPQYSPISPDYGPQPDNVPEMPPLDLNAGSSKRRQFDLDTKRVPKKARLHEQSTVGEYIPPLEPVIVDIPTPACDEKAVDDIPMPAEYDEKNTTNDAEPTDEVKAKVKQVANEMVIRALEFSIKESNKELYTLQKALVLAEQQDNGEIMAHLYYEILELVKKIEGTKKDIKLMKKTIEDPELLAGCVACGMSHAMKEMFIHNHAYVCTVYCAEQLGDSDTCECRSCSAKQQ